MHGGERLYPGSCPHLGSLMCVCTFGQGLLICSSGSGPHNPWTLGLHRGCRGSPTPTLRSSLPLGKPYNLRFPPFLPTMCPPWLFTQSCFPPTLCSGKAGRGSVSYFQDFKKAQRKSYIYLNEVPRLNKTLSLFALGWSHINSVW